MGRGRGIWKPPPEHRGENDQVRTDTKELLERPQHLREESQGGETAEVPE